jgi:hypothetical protein
MNELKQLIEEFNFNLKNTDFCWKTPGHEMYEWAKEHEKVHGNTHGLGDLSLPCKPKQPGEICPACGKVY